MPIKIPGSLPARRVLEGENIFIMGEERARGQDIRPLRLVILNLMPTKIETETQLLRCLSNTPLQIEVDLMQTASYTPTHISPDHLLAFYRTSEDIIASGQKYDGMIITGAPIEQLEFEDVAYWKELCRVMDWAKSSVFSTLYICWGAQAGLYYSYGVRKYPLDKKLFGVFEHDVLDRHHSLFRGFDNTFRAPHSRHTEVRETDIREIDGLAVLSTSKEAGLYICATRDGRRIYVTGHPEYDADTLSREYFRDVSKGLEIDLPVNYFRDNNPENEPVVSWRSHSTLLYTNWLNYFVYQETPFDWATGE